MITNVNHELQPFNQLSSGPEKLNLVLEVMLNVALLSEWLPWKSPLSH